MEVLNPGVTMLANWEVYSLLCDIRDGKNREQKPLSSQPNLANIVYSTSCYLRNTPCTVQSDAVIEKFNKALEEFDLTKAERLQILNLRATTDVEMQLIVEESEERFDDEEVKKLCNIVSKVLPENKASKPSEQEVKEACNEQEPHYS